jgi:HD superfamily phosphohydrolase
MDREEAVEEFFRRVDAFVARSLEGYKPERHAGEKSIRDAIWGTNRFYPWEIAILDSPLLQRLRDIRQTGLAYLVYPTAEHSRFDHTLGVVAVASKIVRSINDRYFSVQDDAKITKKDHMAIRLSAILHDVGHCCLSHVSEGIYGSLPEFRAMRTYVNRKYGVTPKSHEIMSWLIVRSEPFKNFIQNLREKKILTRWECTAEDMDNIADNIIGYRKNPMEKFIADIINGPMDADKLDYLVRDAYFAGPTVVYDLERFLQTVDVIPYPQDKEIGGAGGKIARLSISMEGVTALEQIIISKLMLFSYVYHHHKIRCVEAMCHEALRRLVEIGQQNAETKVSPWLGHASAFLSTSDRTLLPLQWPLEIKTGGAKIPGEILTMLAKRELYKRALIISRLFVEDIDEKEKTRVGFKELLSCSEDIATRDSLREKIYKTAHDIMNSKTYKTRTESFRKAFKIYHVILDIPKAPTVEETVGVMVLVTCGPHYGEDHYVPLIDIFPIEKWVDAYNAIKWRGHIYSLEEAVPYVNLAAKQVLAEAPYHLQFTPPATTLCKVPNRTPGELF